MTYEEKIAYILELPKFTKKNKPEHTRMLMERLGNPQNQFPVVHVAGSNGKGSVCAFIDSVLVQSGLHTGMFSSPHLTNLRERFLIDGKPCSKEQFLAAEERVHRIVNQMLEEGFLHPTFFEYVFAVGMVLFAQEKVACAVVETGLGGRLDATNSVKQPILTIITSISLEHTEILGDTIEKIAAEKAGIIKQGVPVIFDGNEPLAEPVIREAAKNKQAPVKMVSDRNINILLKDGKNIDFSLDSGYDVTRIRIPYPAEYQVRNGALALAAVLNLQERFSLSMEDIKQGFFQVKWPGRMEEIYPEIYLDGAHNVSGIRAFLQAAGQVATQPSILFFSMVKEKDYEQAIRLLCREGNWETIVLTEINGNARTLELECLKACFEKEASGSRILAVRSLREAFEAAMEEKAAGQKLFCTGSLYFVGELKKITGGSIDD